MSDFRVNFMLIGAQKAGTTSLSHQLAQHPQVAFCYHKEPDFFSRHADWQARLPEYHQLYQVAPGKVYGEGSTTYTWIPEYPDTAARLHAYNPHLKLIYIMRQPVERTISHYLHHLQRARTRFPKEVEIFEVPTYINHSRYAMQLRPYLELFPRHALQPVIFEEYIQNPLAALHAIAAHIGVDPAGFDNIDLSAQNQTADRLSERKLKVWLTPLARLFPLKFRNALRGPFMYQMKEKVVFDPAVKQLLWRFLEDDVAFIEGLLGRGLPAWRAGYTE
jgi:hypothetical protein